MAKRRYAIDGTKVARWCKEGRGQGTGRDYQPWLTIHDISSRVRSSRVLGWTTGRLHHCLSDHETNLFYLYDWMDCITDIREQFPLDQELTMKIAESIGVKHPRCPASTDINVMTTDFVLDMETPRGRRILARTVKPSADLASARTIEKLEIERRYWSAQGVDWGIVTERDMPKQFVANIRWVHDARTLDLDPSLPPDYWPEKTKTFLECWQKKAGTTRLKDFLRELGENEGFVVGTPLAVIRHLVAQKILTADMNLNLDFTGPLSQLTLASTDAMERRLA